jgi:hypothetical protein
MGPGLSGHYNRGSCRLQQIAIDAQLLQANPDLRSFFLGDGPSAELANSSPENVKKGIDILDASQTFYENVGRKDFFAASAGLETANPANPGQFRG